MNLYVDADDDAIIAEYIELFGTLAGRAHDQGEERANAVRWSRHQLRLGRDDRFPDTCILHDSFRVRVCERIAWVCEPTTKLNGYRPRWMTQYPWIREVAHVEF
jgi:hypothetical protein